MNYAYSPSNNLFYACDWLSDYGNTWPQDCVDVTEQQFYEFSGEAPNGKIRIAGDDDFPCWGDIPPPSHDELVAVAEAEKQKRIDQANDYMNSKQWPGKAAIGRLKGDELEQYGTWLDYLDALEAVDTSSAPDIDWPILPSQ